MLEYWLRGRGNRALLQSQSTTWRAYCRGVPWRCIWCTCIWRLRETSVKFTEKKREEKKTKQREYHLKSEFLIIERSVQKLSWVIRNEQPRLKKNKERETRKGLAMMLWTRPQFFLGQWLPWCESLKINGGMCEQHRGRLLWCLSPILSKSSL